jgi:class 3 adenylate cyclase
VHHKKKGILEQMKPFVFPEPINLGDRTIQLLDYKDKTVFVGLTATGLNALNPTPYKGRYSMASLTPTTFNTLTTANFITRLDIAGPVLIFIYALLVFLLAFYANPIIAFLLTAGMGVGHYFFSSYMFEHQGLIVPIVAPVLSVIAAFLSANIYLYIEQQKERQKIRGMFSAMVSPEVLKIMEEEPDKFNLRGEKVEASMFSSDVSGFTSISEGVTAQELALILNLYLTPMSNLVMTYGGYVEKYEGDAIKADFGMPLPDNDHAWKACFSALLQQEELTVVQRMLQLKYGVMITARMGVNTGVVNAGNMGSINKMQYCALGEEVAMAEELEPSNKMWETWIAISPETLRLSGDCLETRLLDVVEYEHCTIPVYELIGWKEDVFLKFWEGKPIPKLVIEGWERIIPEKILAYIDYYREHRFDGNGFYDLMLSTFEGLEQSSLDFMKLNDRIEVAGLEKRYLALLEMVDAQGVSVSLDDLDPVDRKEMDGLITARDEAQEPWLQLLNGYLVELKMRTHVTLRLGDKLPQDEINEWLTGIDTLEKNSNCYIKRNRFPEENDNYGNQLKEHLVSILPQPSQGLSEEQLESMKAELKQLGQSIKQSMMAFVAKSQTFAAEYHQMMAKHCLYEEQKRQVCGIFAQGRELYLERKWDEALTLFQKGLEIDPDDGPCMKFSERCESFKANAPAADWDGTWEADW